VATEFIPNNRDSITVRFIADASDQPDDIGNIIFVRIAQFYPAAYTDPLERIGCSQSKLLAYVGNVAV